MNEEQLGLFAPEEVPEGWREHWQGMPEFEQGDASAFKELIVRFRNQEDVEAFACLLGQKITPLTKSLWFPKLEIKDFSRIRYVGDDKVAPSYPIYVISKGRWESRHTVKALEKCGIRYRIVIEPQEFESYSSVIDVENILVLPFSNLGQGSIPARNWVWEHSRAAGFERHWILDDNMREFYRLHNNERIPVDSGAPFKAIEDFCDRYENIALAGMQYRTFAEDKSVIPPVVFNTRIYSCILVKNDLPYGWRGRYNEDTDLSLRALKDGWCTALFNSFLVDKLQTMKIGGGNTDELYKDDGRLKMAESLRDQHPDVVKITRKWGRWQHHVDYKPFKKNKLILRDGVSVDSTPNNYGMELKRLEAA